MFDGYEVVWLTEQRCFAFLIECGAFVSLVKREGQQDVEVVENDDYEFWQERAIDFESDDTDR